MTDLLETVIEAHGGLDRWRELDAISARLVHGGALWKVKGKQGLLDDVFIRASLHQQWVSHHPFGAADRRTAFTPDRVAIETTNGGVVEALERPRASFAGHTLETPWTPLQSAYFVGTAMWTYLTQPFTCALPGFDITELEPWHESGEEWRRLRVVWPGHPVQTANRRMPGLATHSTEQTLYVGADGLLGRHDYNIDIAGGAGYALYIDDYTKVVGILVPAKCRVFPRGSDNQSLGEPLVISIDLSEIAFT